MRLRKRKIHATRLTTRARSTAPPTATPMIAATLQTDPESSWVVDTGTAVSVAREDVEAVSFRTVASLPFVLLDELPVVICTTSVNVTTADGFEVKIVALETFELSDKHCGAFGAQSLSGYGTVSLLIGPPTVPSHCDT